MTVPISIPIPVPIPPLNDNDEDDDEDKKDENHRHPPPPLLLVACVDKPVNLYRVILLSIEHRRYRCDDRLRRYGEGGGNLYDQDMEPRPTTTPPTLIVVTRDRKTRDRFASLAKDFVAGLRKETTTTTMTTTTTAITTVVVKDKRGGKDEEREEEEIVITVMAAKEAYERIWGKVKDDDDDDNDNDNDRRGKGTGEVGAGDGPAVYVDLHDDAVTLGEEG